MKPSVTALLMLCMCLFAGCASKGSSSGGASSGGSGITIFGDIDAGVSGSRNQSR
ncbi:hypothetical protein [Variovorax sp. Sphag1AA]|uniref:hypothetical protein n=1 Tax=Variovorax sp. Sphag1AA TaxID=2587027 RepID=UPI001612833E|nr:hypothetical protein [Variovorax sp. Sphag1AA]MBB3180483.1 hypothetical protein [Variovorax sp. Sphag1AA]